MANIVSYHHNPALSSIPVPCNLVNLVDKLVQDNLDVSKIDKGFLKSMSLSLDDMEELREVILQKSNLLISELSC